jgi:hypothetical protein
MAMGTRHPLIRRVLASNGRGNGEKNTHESVNGKISDPLGLAEVDMEV